MHAAMLRVIATNLPRTVDRRLKDDLVKLADVLVQGEIQRWLDQIEVFGLHLARLDVRQDARYHEAVLTELLARAGVAADFVALPEADRLSLFSCGIDQRLDRLVFVATVRSVGRICDERYFFCDDPRGDPDGF